MSIGRWGVQPVGIWRVAGLAAALVLGGCDGSLIGGNGPSQREIESTLGVGKEIGFGRWLQDPVVAAAVFKGNPMKAQLYLIGGMLGGGSPRLASVEKLECKSAVGLPGYNCSFRWRVDIIDKAGAKTGEDSDVGEGRFVKTGDGWKLMMDQAGR